MTLDAKPLLPKLLILIRIFSTYANKRRKV